MIGFYICLVLVFLVIVGELSQINDKLIMIYEELVERKKEDE